MVWSMKKASFFLSVVVFQLAAAHASVVWQLPAAAPELTGEGCAAEAVRLYRAGCPAAAVDLARPLAETGDADACFLIAFAMEAREPAKLSRAQAMEHYYRKAAEEENFFLRGFNYLFIMKKPEAPAAARAKRKHGGKPKAWFKYRRPKG